MQSPWKYRVVLGVLCLGHLSAGCDDGGDGDGSGGSGSPSSGGTSAGSGGVGAGVAGSSASGTGPGAAGASRGGSAAGGTGSGNAGSGGAAGASSAGASAAGTGGAGGAGGGAAGGGGEAGGSAAAMLSDAQILGVLDTLNLGEVTEAQAAEPRLMDEDVQEFADEMIADHGAARQQVSAAAASLQLQLAESSLQSQLDTASDARVRAVMDADAAMVDDVYISGQVMAHTAAVALLGELVTAADAQPLKDLITTQRADVQEHLEEAMTLDD